MEPLSRRQKDVLAIIEEQLASQGYPPSIREIANRLGLTGTVSVVQHLNALERKGFIRRSRSSSRGIALITEDVLWKQEQLPGVDWENSFVTLSIVDKVYPEMQEPESEDTIGKMSLDRFAKTSNTAFLLNVHGDAMREAGIIDGDLALVRPHQNDANNNDIVVVLLNGDTMIRRCLHERGFIRLQPANPSFDPVFVRHGSPGFHIIGTVTGIFRTLQKQAENKR